MRHYATLYDQAYTAKGIALYHSLVAHHNAEPFTLHVLALDMETYWLLDSMRLPHVQVTPITLFEHIMNLAAIRTSRSWAEYCWTCASQYMEYIFQAYSHPQLTYLDADLYFFSDPSVIYEEMGDASIAIVPHRFDRHCAKSIVNGVYNVGWLTIRADTAGITCLSRWAQQCREWCYLRNEDGKFADQGYLDSWPEEYGPNCCVIENIGVGVAPWNVQQYQVTQSDAGVSVQMAKVGPHKFALRYPIVLYHFHEFKNASKLTNHPIRSDARRLIYAPYIAAIEKAELLITTHRHALEAQRALAQAESERA